MKWGPDRLLFIFFRVVKNLIFLPSLFWSYQRSSPSMQSTAASRSSRPLGAKDASVPAHNITVRHESTRRKKKGKDEKPLCVCFMDENHLALSAVASCQQSQLPKSSWKKRTFTINGLCIVPSATWWLASHSNYWLTNNTISLLWWWKMCAARCHTRTCMMGEIKSIFNLIHPQLHIYPTHTLYVFYAGN